MTSSTPTAAGFLRSACRILFISPLVRWFTSRGRRRGLVVAYLAMLGGFPALTWITDRSWPSMIVALPLIAASLVLGGVTDGLFDRPLSALDERQRHLRHTVFANPYLVGAGLGLVSGAVFALAFGSNDRGAMAGAVAAVIVVIMLPTMALAWRLPREMEDGE